MELIPEPCLLLLELISRAIRGQKPLQAIPENTDWPQIYQIALRHQVSALLYPLISQLSAPQQPSPDLMKEWKQKATISGLAQYLHIDRASQVIQAFQKAQIPLIAMKGLVLREFYPQPEFRLMGDADFMIKKEDLKKIKKLLAQLGYRDEKYPCPIHCGFDHPNYPRVELHTSLIDPDFSFSSKLLEEEIWKKPGKCKINQVESLCFSPDVELVFLFLHLAKHYVKSELSLRQLCDLVLFIESHQDQLQWDLVLQMSQEAKLETFLLSFLAFLQQYFHLSLPPAIQAKCPTKPELIHELLQDIFDLGAYQVSWEVRRMAGEQLRRAQKQSTQSQGKTRLHYILSVIFPRLQNLDYRFSYAQKIPILYPIALIHRFLWALTYHRIPIKRKYQLLMEASSFSQQRSALLNDLNLLK
ncbi:MAG TPA: nucleotidyltransferase family protein [Caldisericia bacterium]|nr:nucleotidyltransferase family protein [Caldisericia bacterium]